MKMIKLAVLSGFAALTLNCGSSAGGSTTVSCDITTAGVQTCYEYVFSAGYPQATIDAQKTACDTIKGKVGTSCPSEKNVGGCKSSTTAGAYTFETITWSYTGTAKCADGQTAVPKK